MSLRRNRRKSPLERLAKGFAGLKLAEVAGKAARKSAKGAGKTAKGVATGKAAKKVAERPARLGAGAVAIAVAAALLAKRRRTRREELGYGPPNESVPSHETLAPAQEAAPTG